MDIKAYIREKRPSLSESSVSTYNSTLVCLYKKLYPTATEIDISKFSDTEGIMDFLKDVKPSYRRTILNSLLSITGDEKYRKAMLADNAEVEKAVGAPLTEYQKENWVETNEIQLLWNKMKRETDLLYKKGDLLPDTLQQIQQFVILSLVGGVFIAPRRSKDYFDIKIKNINRETDNYIDKNELVFNSYKTAKQYGEQRVSMPKELKAILTKWIKKNNTDYLLHDINNNQLSAVKMNQRISKLFDGKNIGINQMRRTYLSGKYAHLIPELEAKKSDFTAMGSNVKSEKHYIKENEK